MSKEVLAIIAALIGGALTGMFSFFASKAKAEGHTQSQFQQRILERIGALEKEQKQLEYVVMTWKGRYWSLYTWLVNFCLANGISTFPPSFHEMEYEEMKDRFKEQGKKKKKKEPNENT